MLKLHNENESRPERTRSISVRHHQYIYRMMLFGCIAFASAAVADEKITTFEPGDPRIQEDTTKPHTSRWAMIHLTQDSPPEQRGVWLDRHEILEVDGRQIHKFQTDVVWVSGRPRRDVIFWDQSTMETISAELENYNNKGGWAYYIYDKNKVSQVYRREPFGEAYSESRELENRVFEPGHGLVFANIVDLQPGEKLRYPYHQRYSDTVQWVTLVAQDYEEIETSKYGVVKTLPLQSNLGWKYWTVPEPPYVYRLDIPTADNAIDRWELLEYIVQD